MESYHTQTENFSAKIYDQQKVSVAQRFYENVNKSSYAKLLMQLISVSVYFPLIKVENKAFQSLTSVHQTSSILFQSNKSAENVFIETKALNIKKISTGTLY